MSNHIEFASDCKYLQVIAKYFDKNSSSIHKAMDIDESELISLAVNKKCDLEWFKIIFNLYSKVKKAPRKEDFENALKNENFAQISKECQAMIQENYNKFYPK